MFNWFKNFFGTFEFDPFGIDARNRVDALYEEIMSQDIEDGPRKDAEAISSDWKMVLGDFNKVYNKK